MSHYIYLTHENCAPDSHRNGNNREIDACEIKTPNSYVFSSEDISPEKSGERSRERRAKSSIVYSYCHGIDSCPEVSICDRDCRGSVYLYPGLNHPREKDRGANICPRELQVLVADEVEGG